MKQSLQESSFITGVLTFRNFVIDSPRAQEIHDLLANAHDMANEVYEALQAELMQICRYRELEVHNLVVAVGRANIAAVLNGEVVSASAISYGALGSDNTAVNSADTTLGNEVARKLFSRRVRTNAQIVFDFFYSQADTDGTYEEFGMFIGGTATLDSGTLFNHALTGGWSKTDTEAMTVSVTIDVNDS